MKPEQGNGFLMIHAFGAGSVGMLPYCGVPEIVTFLTLQNVMANLIVAGVGKTILAYLKLLSFEYGLIYLRSIVMNYLEESFVYDEQVAIACVYFDHKQDYQPVAILRSILKHVVQQRIISQDGAVSDEVRQFYKNHTYKEREPSLPEVSELLLGELRDFSEIFVVLDALDECGASATARKTVLEEVQKLQPKLRLMVTGRPFAATHMSIFEIYETLEIQAIESDVERFVRGRIKIDECLHKYASHGTELGTLIVKTVVDKAQGM